MWNKKRPLQLDILEEDDERGDTFRVDSSDGKCNPSNDVNNKFEVQFLGTGAAAPSKQRNCSSIMITVSQGVPPTDSKVIVLLDAGESVSSQLFQACEGDTEKFDEILLNIKVIWISHHHADHSSGLPMLLEHIKLARTRSCNNKNNNKNTQTTTIATTTTSTTTTPPIHYSKYDMVSYMYRSKRTTNSVLCFVPETIQRYIQFVVCIAGIEDIVELKPITTTLARNHSSSPPLSSREIQQATDGVVMSFESVPVQHCAQSYGLVMKLQHNHTTIVYSGDCRPSYSLVKKGKDCDLLIHEATFDDMKLEEALRKRHSTVSEAFQVSTAMNAKQTIFTHFSQRYPLHGNSLRSSHPMVMSQWSGFTLEEGGRGPVSSLPLSLSRPFGRCCFAIDFLKIAFPMSSELLYERTETLSRVLARLDEEKKESARKNS
jgi:ribonuclease BN (tRNA processing enzyme)